MAARAGKILEHAQPAHAVAPGELDRALEKALGLGDETTLIAAADVAPHGQAPSTALPGDDRLSVLEADLCELSEGNRLPLGVEHGQPPHRLRRAHVLPVEFHAHIETLLALVDRPHGISAESGAHDPGHAAAAPPVAV